ncbi:MAG: tRNA (adenosine(37)-N6)-threonylcarbamoyltransferase complex transferase subunit TsaD, partial [Planctomycetota bacterium]
MGPNGAPLQTPALVLGIESSCDETAAAVVRAGTEILSSVVASQDERHAPFGGVVPEIASRAHTEVISRVVESALSRAGVSRGELLGIAVANRPGLLGSLLVGLTAAKALAWAWEL